MRIGDLELDDSVLSLCRDRATARLDRSRQGTVPGDLGLHLPIPEEAVTIVLTTDQIRDLTAKQAEPVQSASNPWLAELDAMIDRIKEKNG